MKRNYQILAFIFFLSAIFLRILLWWSNPPSNSFDDHFEPIFMIMQYGAIPANDACMQCYQPPVFYWVSAMIGNIAVNMGIGFNLMKLLQFICCFYGIMTVGIIYLIINKLHLPDFSKLIAFGTVCFLPRHIYMSAMNSNDTISYLFVAICLYLVLLAIERKFPPVILFGLSVFMTLTIFTKYTSLVILPVVFTVLVWAFIKRIIPDRNKFVVSLFLALALPLLVFSAYAVSNKQHYGGSLPWNLNRLDPATTQPRDQGPVSFFTFKPWESIATPILVPGQLTSFWTLLYSGTWFDTEPKFLCSMDTNPEWWSHYFCWLNGEEAFPAGALSLSIFSIVSGALLLTFGLVPLFFTFLGGFYYLSGCWGRASKANLLECVKLIMFPVLLISNAAIIIALALRLPVFSAMKASYFLNSMPAFAVFLGIGLQSCENRHILKKSICIIFGALFILVSLHILHISLTFT